ncbi:hypothetical protein HHL28_07965 [Aerophototrophica crusticola]|uniref:Uncharacterized protein n=1 Tax=Aerophototrophica crusticola TaxID=1709002 RepID=A0A858R669_9PROT|nr:hypothetical protein HHL28_07965 [Rhodospirillaceae bacterium B3]
MPRLRTALTVLAALALPATLPVAAAEPTPPKKATPKPSKAAAKAPCYTPAEFEAEQAIRLHTELMVVGLTCQAMDPKDGPSLFAQYKMFTLKHQAAVQGWEKSLIGHFKRAGSRNPTKEFDSFRTRLANEMSQRAIALSAQIFCENHVPVVGKAMSMPDKDVQKAILAHGESAGIVRVAAAPRCDQPAQAISVAAPSAPKPAEKPAAKAPAKKEQAKTAGSGSAG